MLEFDLYDVIEKLIYKNSSRKIKRTMQKFEKKDIDELLSKPKIIQPFIEPMKIDSTYVKIFKKIKEKNRIFFRDVRKFIEKGNFDKIHDYSHAGASSIVVGYLTYLELKEIIPFSEVEECIELAVISGLGHDLGRNCEENDNEGNCKGNHHEKRGAEIVSKMDYLKDFSEYKKSMIYEAVLCHKALSDYSTTDDKKRNAIVGSVHDGDNLLSFGSLFWTYGFPKIVKEKYTNLKQVLDRSYNQIKFNQNLEYTFRTNSGKWYGPLIIEKGIEFINPVLEKLEQLQ